MKQQDQTAPSTLSATAIIEEVQRLDQAFEAIAHTEILDQFLERIPKQNFRALANVEGSNEKLKKRHFIICTIERILELAKRYSWSLCQRHDFIYLYNGAYWRQLSERELKYFLGKSAEKMGVDPFDARFYAFQDLLYKQFLTAAHLPIHSPSQQLSYINLQNGTYEVGVTGSRLKAFDELDFLTYQLPFAYDPEAKAPLFESYLQMVLPDVELQYILAEYLAYLFTPQLKLEKTLMLYGTGANGKSVFFEIVNALLGKNNVSSYSLQSLTNETGYYRAKLANVLVNYATEINGKLESSIFKQLVSGEPVEARLPYGEPFTLTQYARLIFNCNHLPKEVEHSDAYFRRFLIIPFKVTIPEAQQDKELADKIIRSELSGVFNWVLKGFKRLMFQKRFTVSQESNRQIKQYRKESDNVHLFLEEQQLVPSTNTWKKLQELYSDYKLFCYNDQYRPLGKVNFRKRLEAIGIQTKKANVGVVVYLKKVVYQDVLI